VRQLQARSVGRDYLALAHGVTPESGRIDAAGQGDETLPYLMALDPDTFALVGEPIRHTLMGIAMPKDQTELHQAVAEAMRELLADGTYQRLLEKYQMTPNAISDITINGGT